jgi:hypothetical protein
VSRKVQETCPYRDRIQDREAAMRVDLHTHTVFSSDSDLPLEDAVKGWQQQGIDCVAVTDHNTIAGSLALQELGLLRVIVASEVRTCEGEIIGLFLEEEIERGLTPEETIQHIRDQNGLVMIPHPFDRFRRSRLTEAALMRILPKVDIMEVFNARTAFGWDNRRAEKLAATHGLVAAAGSDSHTAHELGRAYVEMDDFDSPETFLDSLRAGKLMKRKSSWLVHASTRLTKLRSRSW